MKKLLIIHFIFGFQTLWACDICGGASSIAGANGVVPFFNINQVAIGFAQTNMKHPITPYNQVGNEKVKNDLLSRVNLQSKLFIHPRWQWTTSIPFVNNKRVLESKNQIISGIGDIQTSLNYVLINQSDSTKQRFKALILIGGGFGLPTGKYQIRGEDLAIYPNGLQPGTGAFQYTLQQQSSIRYKTLGLLFNSNIILSAENEILYQLGNIHTQQFHLFKNFKKGNHQWIPQLGISYLRANTDQKNNTNLSATQIKALNAHASVNWYYKQWNIQINANLPLSQELDYEQPKQESGLSMRLGYLLINK